MTPRTRILSLLFIVAAIIAFATFTAALPVPTRNGDQLVISPEDIVPSENFEILVPEPDHECGHDESDYENPDNDEEDEDEDDDDDDELEGESELEEESTEEDIQAAGEVEDDYYIGQTYTGLVFDSNTGKGIALTTVDPDQDLLELALFLRRKKVTSFEEIWNDEEKEESEDGLEDDDDDTSRTVADIRDIQSVDDDEEEDDAFESET